MRAIFYVMAAALLALACGDSGTSGDAADLVGDAARQLEDGADAAREAADGAVDEAGTALERTRDVAASAAQELAAGAVSPEGQTCLALVGEQKYVDAVTVCTSALQRDPDSEPLREALETAREGAAARMGGAIDAARESAGAGMEGALDAAREGAAGRMGEALGTRTPPAPVEQ